MPWSGPRKREMNEVKGKFEALSKVHDEALKEAIRLNEELTNDKEKAKLSRLGI